MALNDFSYTFLMFEKMRIKQFWDEHGELIEKGIGIPSLDGYPPNFTMDDVYYFLSIKFEDLSTTVEKKGA